MSIEQNQKKAVLRFVAENGVISSRTLHETFGMFYTASETHGYMSELANEGYVTYTNWSGWKITAVNAARIRRDFS